MLARFGISRRLTSYHEHNAETARRRILEQLQANRSVALISDAGMPSVSDPGFKLVREVIAAGSEVYVVPGATALTAAITVSGLPTDSFFFAGFLPQKSIARRTRIEELGTVPATLIVYESPHRISATLTDLADILGNRQAALARELTKRYEEVRRGSLKELAVWSTSEPPRGEIAIVVSGHEDAKADDVVDDTAIVEAAREALIDMAPAAAAKAISKRLGVQRSRVYDLILFLKKEQRESVNDAAKQPPG